MRAWLVLACLQALAALRISPPAPGSKGSCCRLDPVLQSTLRLPIWPVYGGVVAQIAEWLGLRRISRGVLDGIGGRVIPMQLNGEAAFTDSRLLLLVHHKHSFTKGDPIRALTRLIIPEGFPAHGHSGLMTVTMTMEDGGGLSHRDSEGLQQEYGRGDVQWMKSCRGILHEEMWSPCRGQERVKEDVELYQLWVDIPAQQKELPPSTTVVRRADMPVHRHAAFECKAIAGDVLISANDGSSSSSGSEDVHLRSVQPELSTAAIDIAQIRLSAGCELRLSPDHPSQHVFVHVTAGEIEVPSAQGPLQVLQGNVLKYAPPAKHGSGDVEFSLRCGSEGAQVLVLVAPPADNPVIMSGPCVASSEEQLQRKLRVFGGIAQAYWPYTLSDDEWKNHINKFSLQAVLDRAERLM